MLLTEMNQPASVRKAAIVAFLITFGISLAIDLTLVLLIAIVRRPTVIAMFVELAIGWAKRFTLLFILAALREAVIVAKARGVAIQIGTGNPGRRPLGSDLLVPCGISIFPRGLVARKGPTVTRHVVANAGPGIVLSVAITVAIGFRAAFTVLVGLGKCTLCAGRNRSYKQWQPEAGSQNGACQKRDSCLHVLLVLCYLLVTCLGCGDCLQR